MMGYFIRCETCLKPKKNKFYEFYEWARNDNRELNPRLIGRMDKFEEERFFAGIPPIGFRDFCPEHEEKPVTYELTPDAVCTVDHDHVGEFAARGPNVYGFTGPIHKIDSKINELYLTNCGKYLRFKIKSMPQTLIFLTAALDPRCKTCQF
jgi:hypothetical protein